jgi:hypothetical protein
MRRQEFVDDGQNLRRGRVWGLVEQVDEAGGQQQKERDGRQEDVERDSPGEEENVVLAAVVPDSLRVIAKKPTEPGG